MMTTMLMAPTTRLITETMATARSLTTITTTIFPSYSTQRMNNSYCLFTFNIDGKRVSINCTNGSTTLNEFSSTIANNIYFQNVTQVSNNNESFITEYPFYLCSSTFINVSNQTSSCNTCDTKSLNYLIQIFQYMKNNNIIIEIQCNCSSFYLLNASEKITNRFSCSNISYLNRTEFEKSNEMDCLRNLTLSSNKRCEFERSTSSSLSSDKTWLIVIILAPVGLIIITTFITYGIYYKRKRSVKDVRISVLSTAPYRNDVYI